jgi:hypothetical protein
LSGLPTFDEFTAPRGFHGGNGFRIRIKRLEREGFFLSHANQQQTESIGHSKADFL